MHVTDRAPDLGRTISKELLEPTDLYVNFALACLKDEIDIKAFSHITAIDSSTLHE